MATASILQEHEATKRALRELPEVGRLQNVIIGARDETREIAHAIKGILPFNGGLTGVIGDLNLVLELLLERATLAAYNLGYEDGRSAIGGSPKEDKGKPWQLDRNFDRVRMP